ncbi:MAG: aldo/keto reductase [Sphaerochaetaceae bacterium]
MRYRELGKTRLKVSEIGLGGEWLERHNTEEVALVINAAKECGINILDCWMSNPKVRSDIGDAMKGSREHWIIQAHLGSTWKDGQYVRTRELDKVKPAFEDYLQRFHTDYIDLGMIHFVDSPEEFHQIMDGDFLKYVQSLKASGTIRHIGMSTHNPVTAKLAAESGIVEMIMFSINPAFDLLPPTDELDTYFKEDYGEGFTGIDPAREQLYKLCEEKGIGITVMKPYAGGRLFSAQASPFSVALTPIQCIHYALTRPAVAAVMAGSETIEQIHQAASYETATEQEKDYASVLSKAPRNAFSSGKCTYCGHCAPCPKKIDIAMVGKYYDLAEMQKQATPSLQDHYDALEAHASDCIKCHACEKRCPFGVKIVDRMERTKQMFGH